MRGWLSRAPHDQECIRLAHNFAQPTARARWRAATKYLRTTLLEGGAPWSGASVTAEVEVDVPLDEPRGLPGAADSELGHSAASGRLADAEVITGNVEPDFEPAVAQLAGLAAARDLDAHRMMRSRHPLIRPSGLWGGGTGNG